MQAQLKLIQHKAGVKHRRYNGLQIGVNPGRNGGVQLVLIGSDLLLTVDCPEDETQTLIDQLQRRGKRQTAEAIIREAWAQKVPESKWLT